jgi:two-component system chemotaxis response regulator CheB
MPGEFDKPIRVLIAEDTRLFTQALRDVLEEDRGIVVCGMACNGREAVEKTVELKPDLIVMDINMPVMSGMEAIEQIMASNPTPILVVTANASQRVLFQALEHGALDLVLKQRVWPSGQEEQGEFREKVRLLSSIRVIRHVAGKLTRLKQGQPGESPAAKRVVAIAGSTGGPRALHRVLSALPADFPAPVLVVQHMAYGFSHGLVNWLDGECPLEVRIASHGDPIEPGRVLLAPDGVHMTVGKGGAVVLEASEPVSGQRPSATVLFRSVAKAFGTRAVGVVITGMGRDGAEGLRDIYEGGGITIAQDEQTSLVFGMPKAAAELGVVQAVLPLDEIPQALLKAVLKT